MVTRALASLLVVSSLPLALGAAGRGRLDGIRQSRVQQPPVVEWPKSSDTGIDLVREYRSGNPDAAVASLVTRPRIATFASGRDPAEYVAIAWLYAEAGMRQETFGQYSRSAPLVPADRVVGLNGMFDMGSVVAYRAIDAAVPLVNGSDGGRMRDAVRFWFVDTVSYCLAHKLDCTDALLLAADAAFPNDADMLLLRGSVAESRGRWADAEFALNRALSRRPTLVEARVRLGNVLGRRGRTAAALAQLTQGLDEAARANDDFARFFGGRVAAALHTRLGHREVARTLSRDIATITAYSDASVVRDRTGLDADGLYAAAQWWTHVDHVRDARLAVRD